MEKATDELLKTHLVVDKVLEGFDVKNARFPEIMKTLHRTFLAHAWLQDEILLPVLREKSPTETTFLNDIAQEHKNLDRLLKELLDTSLNYTGKLKMEASQIRSAIAAHFKKEKEVMYPLAEKNIESETLNKLGNEMAQHGNEIREATQI